MFLQKIRRMVAKHRTVLLVVVILLCVGILGSFAVGGSSGVNNAAWESMTYDEKIAYYDEFIQDAYDGTVEESDLETASYMTQLYLEKYSLYESAYNQTTDEAAVQGYLAGLQDALDSARAYMEHALEISEGESDATVANIYATLGFVSLQEGKMDEAEETLLTALELDETNINAQLYYADYLYYGDSYEDAEAYLSGLMEGIPSDGEVYSAYSQRLQMYQLYEYIFSMAASNGTVEVVE